MRKVLGRWTKLLGLVALTAALVLASTGVAFAATKRVRATADNTWRPAHPYIDKGDRVRWVNNTNRTHNVVAQDTGTDWNYSVTLSPGESVRKRFRRLGNFYFDCTLHGGMSGGIHVRQYPG